MRLGIALPTTGDSVSAETITEVASTAERILEAVPRLEALGVTELLWNLDDDGPLDDQLSRLAQLAGASV
jgi:hypothetical protein